MTSRFSDHIIEEVTRTLRQKFDWPTERVEEAKQVMGGIARHVSPSHTIEVIMEDPDDNRVLECAVEAGSEYVVTGDKDLLRLGQHDAIRIVKVADLLQALQSGGD